MQSRMEKYNVNNTTVRSRTQKNKDLYENVRNSTINDFDVNSNVSVIGNSSKNINVTDVRKLLDEKYNTEMPKRRTIDIPELDETIIEDNIVDTKEYDINAILEKAKAGKNVDYNKERLKKVRDAQYDILNNLDLELKKIEKPVNTRKKQEEEELLNLINTITELEMKNKNEQNNKPVDLLEDLTETTEIYTEPEDTEVYEEPTEEVKVVEEEPIEEKEEDHIEETLKKIDVDVSKYEDFSDISKRDIGSIVIKIVIFVVIAALLLGAVYILNSVLDLGLF